MEKSSEKLIKINDAVDEILQCYHDRWTAAFDNIFEHLVFGKENNDRGYKDSAFMIYAANNGHDYRRLYNEIFDVLDEEGTETIFKHLKRISDNAEGRIERKLLTDCQKLCVVSEENLTNYISDFLKNKVDDYLKYHEKKVVHEFFIELKNNFEKAKTIIQTLSDSDEEKSIKSNEEINLKISSQEPNGIIATRSAMQVMEENSKEAGAEI